LSYEFDSNPNETLAGGSPEPENAATTTYF